MHTIQDPHSKFIDDCNVYGSSIKGRVKLNVIIKELVLAFCTVFVHTKHPFLTPQYLSSLKYNLVQHQIKDQCFDLTITCRD